MNKSLTLFHPYISLRCYPKIDGGVYTFNPGEEFSPEEEAEVNKELGGKASVV